MMIEEILEGRQAELITLCREHQVMRLAVFGSAARADFDPERSDVDLLVEFGEGVEHFARNFFSLQEKLAVMMGRPVDLLTFDSIRNPFLQRSIDADQQLLYAA